MSNIIEKPSTFSFQPTLPRYPIPPLEKTLERWLVSIEPFATEKELVEAKQLAHDFLKPDGLGKKLQARLQHHDKTQSENWLENWWLTYAYHIWRDPQCININWGCLAKDHPEKPPSPPKDFKGFTRYQLARASHLIYHMTQLHQSIIDEKFPVDMFGDKTAQCMNQYKNLFGVTRIPEWKVDRLESTFPCLSTHIVVLVNGLIFKLDIYKTFPDGTRKINSMEEIEYQLTQLVNFKEFTKHPDFTHLTGCHRDLWTEFRQGLIKHSYTNLQSLETIESALFSVSLDDNVISSDIREQYHATFHGNGSNRWFDKSLNFNLSACGMLGMNGEHSPLDALIPSQFFDYCVSQPFDWNKDTSNEFNSNSLRSEPEIWKAKGLVKDIHRPQQLLFDIPSGLLALIQQGRQQLNQVISNSDSRIVIYKSYGSEFIKKQGKVPVDGYLQMVQQLNYYQFFNKVASVYETASIRKFKNGRTEAIRAASQDAKNFIVFSNNLLKQNGDSIRVEDYQKAYKLLVKACQTHRINTKEASIGNGIDRHLLGLRVCLRNNESHPIFQHPTFINSGKWDLSTSQLFTSKRLTGAGFGAVQPQGVGINYYHRPQELTFTIECKKDNKTLTGGTEQWEEGLNRCLELVKDIVSKGNVEKSKL
jgi:carnitine O-acetyltransferase